MSFRIEDILKNDFASSKNLSEKRVPATPSSSYSILQQTLLNKVNPHYVHPIDYYSCEQFFSGTFCEKSRYLTNSYPEYFISNAHPYLPLYTRNRVYPNYESLPLMYHITSKRKGGQVRFTSIQTDALEKRFVSHKYLSPEDRRILADSLKLTDKQVKTWFQNRRAKWRRSNSTSSNNTDTECEKLDESDSERNYNETYIA
ncbi:hypothetical protein RN001_006819 [Aquatica leii]|uniref:Homeobox domain-containing protein n=1 Tax=Aquatica leii TaxID=1421715 RepID=A0AAN7SSB6_9COLE|nr:hypothetical protein RN001_006819 [Aquatica leii]